MRLGASTEACTNCPSVNSRSVWARNRSKIESAGSIAAHFKSTAAEIRDVAAAGEKMPQKSTYFYPKMITGMVMNVKLICSG